MGYLPAPRILMHGLYNWRHLFYHIHLSQEHMVTFPPCLLQHSYYRIPIVFSLVVMPRSWAAWNGSSGLPP